MKTNVNAKAEDLRCHTSNSLHSTIH